MSSAKTEDQCCGNIEERSPLSRWFSRCRIGARRSYTKKPVEIFRRSLRPCYLGVKMTRRRPAQPSPRLAFRTDGGGCRSPTRSRLFSTQLTAAASWLGVAVAVVAAAAAASDAAVVAGNAATPGVTARVAARDLCISCVCVSKQIRCDRPGVKLYDVVNVRVPDDYNILDLSSNLLTRLHQDSFAVGRDVTEINAAYNQIGSVAARTFVAFNNLTSLNLAHNNLATLEDDSLAGLPNLEKLDISQNRFQTLHPEYFSQLPTLKCLILNQNRIKDLRSATFRNNTRLTHLFLNQMGINELHKDLFEYTRDIRVLHLEGNYFETVPHDALLRLQLLEVLVLSGNPLHHIAPLEIPRLPNLQQLVLSNMYNLLTIETNAFSRLPMLRNLKIQHCRNLYYIDPNAFVMNLTSPAQESGKLAGGDDSRATDDHWYPHLKHLVIHDTGISTLSSALLRWEWVDDADLSENPFHCNCALAWLVDFVRQHEVNDGVRCDGGPPPFTHRVIGTLSAGQLTCDDHDPQRAHETAVRERRRQQAAAAAAAAAMLTDDAESGSGGRSFSLLHLLIVLMLTATAVLAVLLALTMRQRGLTGGVAGGGSLRFGGMIAGGGGGVGSGGFVYRKLGKTGAQQFPIGTCVGSADVGAGGDNVLYMKTTIDNY